MTDPAIVTKAFNDRNNATTRFTVPQAIAYYADWNPENPVYIIDNNDEFILSQDGRSRMIVGKLSGFKRDKNSNVTRYVFNVTEKIHKIFNRGRIREDFERDAIFCTIPNSHNIRVIRHG